MTNREIIEGILKEVNELLDKRLKNELNIGINNGLTYEVIKKDCDNFLDCRNISCDDCPFSFGNIDEFRDYNYCKSSENETTAIREISW